VFMRLIADAYTPITSRSSRESAEAYVRKRLAAEPHYSLWERALRYLRSK
jgi:hypothetical protein